jgi:hypothetical protein
MQDSSQYRGVAERNGAWRATRTLGRRFRLGTHHSGDEAAHVWDLSAICLGLGTANLNFPASEYEAGGRWEEEARESSHVDIDELVAIWSRQSKQRTLDGVHSRPPDFCRLVLVRHRGTNMLSCDGRHGRHSTGMCLVFRMWIWTCVCMLTFQMQALGVHTSASGLRGMARSFVARARDAEGVPWQPRNVNQVLRGWQVKVCRQIKRRPRVSRTWYFGLCSDRAHAAQVADRAALVVFGEHTPLNLPSLLTAKERRVLSAVEDIDAYAEKCSRTAPCAAT